MTQILQPPLKPDHACIADKRLLTSAEGYLNRYRNGWSASAAAVKAWVDEAARRRGKPVGGQAPVPLNELPVPVPISRFLWPFVSPPAPANKLSAADSAWLCNQHPKRLVLPFQLIHYDDRSTAVPSHHHVPAHAQEEEVLQLFRRGVPMPVQHQHCAMCLHLMLSHCATCRGRARARARPRSAACASTAPVPRCARAA